MTIVSSIGEALLPLDRCGRFRADIVDDAVDSFHAVDDVVGHFREEIVGQMDPVGRHAVRRSDGAQRDATLVGPLVAHHADALDRQEDGSRLPHLVVKSGGTQGVDIDSVHVLQNLDLPGRDVDTVMGIDIETTGTDPARVYIIDAGFEFMNMISPRPAGEPAGYRYEQDYYETGDAYGQARLSFGVPTQNALLGNPLILDLTGIDVRDRASADFRLFDEWPEAQIGLLQRLEQQPYVAHNARFEHSFFMLNVAGYAESYRAGNITIIDTLPMSRRWDEGSIPDDEHPHGNNTLDAYAKRQGALDASKSERHLGLEDTHIMLVAMKHHLGVLHAEGRGPWGAGGRPGNGGKRCGKRW